MFKPSLNIEQRGYEYGVKHLLSSRMGPLLDVLEKDLDLSREDLKKLLQLGAVYVKGARIFTDLLLEAETYVRVHTKPRRFPANDHLWRHRLVFSNENFAVVNKPAALPCHATVDNVQENVLAYLAEDLGETFFLTHRLDVPTQGLLVVAKTKKFQSAFNQLVAAREFQKFYRALVEVSHAEAPLVFPVPGFYRHHMQVSPRAPKIVTNEENPHSQICDLEILEARAFQPGLYEVLIQLHTGRTHQIRAQMAALGFPIQGDHLYGAKKINHEDKIALTACEIRFHDPFTQEDREFKLDRG